MSVRGYEETCRTIEQNYRRFEHLVTRTSDYLQRGLDDEAVVYAEIAANFAMSHHAGVFASPSLERLLLTIGRRNAGKIKRSALSVKSDAEPQRILHVLTRASGVGGDSRFVARWIRQDANRSHSVVMTRQGATRAPQPLRDAAASAGGKVYVLNERRGSFLAWAQGLREIASGADLVALHVHPHDIIPLLAFADKADMPPVVYVNHADHVFWAGVGISDVVANLRESGASLSMTRRGVEAQRCGLLPTVLSPVRRALTRLEAKAQLGLTPDSVVLVSIARPHKYVAFQDLSYPEALLPVLEKYPQTVLLVIGPAPSGPWNEARPITQGRVRAFGQREDTAVFYQAADIYIDSYPIVSITSLLEAGSYATPLVSRSPLSEGMSVLGADTPALSGNLLVTHDLNEYREMIVRLIEDSSLRSQIGKRTQEDIERVHVGSHWQEALEALYRQTLTVPRITGPSSDLDQRRLDEVDLLLPALFKDEPDLDQILEHHLQLMPLRMRLRSWTATLRSGTRTSPGRLLPEWLGTSVERWRG